MLTITNLSYRILNRVLLDDVRLSISDGWRVGIVGANGVGKSTLFKLITGELDRDGGEVSITARHRIGVVRQDMPDTDKPLVEQVLAADEERTALLHTVDHEQDPYVLAEAHNRLNEIEAYAAPARAAAILSGLGFSEEKMQQPFSALSGGWRMRVALASALFVQPELLLLDEPTNHLDLEAIMWLEGYLASYPHTLLIISHDRALLNRCVDHIVHVADSKLTTYTGNYDSFEKERAEKQGLQQKMHEKQQAQRAHIQKFIDRFRSKATKARQAQSRIKMLEKMDLVDAVLADRGRTFTFPNPDALPPPVISINHANIGYGEANPILRNVHETIIMEDRIALLGANGNGKSTLMKLIAGKLGVQTGSIHRHNKLKIGYFAQHQAEELDITETPYQTLSRLYSKKFNDFKEAQVRAKLGQFGFSKDLADNPIGSLSGGEKARLLFAVITFETPHILLLDEPTNHLDMESREALVQALNDYEGAVVLVSHDPSMVERVADSLWLVENGTVRDFDGDLSDYRRYIVEQRRTAKQADKPVRVDEAKEKRRRSAEARKSIAPLLREAEAIEKQLKKLLADKQQLEVVMADAAFYNDAANVQKTQMKYAQLQRDIAAREEAWLAALDVYEQAKAEIC